ncbi:MAG TPA: SDR family oxidoreductase [Anaeromyxobacteraceae bacterium]|nr:SDR family oxidoreductase [Anaeromyxobacteraceae bacterium]
MDGKVCLVTGATGGIGRETALELARRGATVAIVARDEARGEATLAEVKRAGNGAAPVLFRADFGSLADVRRLAEEASRTLPRLDVLVNNAGAIHMERKRTADGHEMTFAVNHLAPFLLTGLLLPKLRASGGARVVNVASEAHRGATLDFDDLMGERGYSGWKAYARSKLANLLFTYELARRLEGSGVTANALHPGVVATGFGRNDPGWLRVAVRLLSPFLLDVRRGAATTLHVAAAPELERVTGRYFAKSRETASSPASLDREAQRRLWEASERLTGLPAA